MSRIGPDSRDDRRRRHCASRHESWLRSRFEFIVSSPAAGPEDTRSHAAVHVAAVGDLDRAAAVSLPPPEVLSELVRDARVTVDLSAVTLIDSEGVRLLQRIADEVRRRRGQVVFIDARPPIAQVIDLTGATFELRRRDDLGEPVSIG